MTQARGDLEKGEHVFIGDKNANWQSHYGNYCSSKKMKIDLPHDPTITLLGI